MPRRDALQNSEIPTARAAHFSGLADAQGFPSRRDWPIAPPIQFCADWRGENATLECETEVRLLWSPEFLYLRFRARYRVITVFSNAEPDGRRDQLWNRDVAEAFLQPHGSAPRSYKEFEVSPNGFWIDLDITPGAKRNLQSKLRCRAEISEPEKTWVGELALPMKCLTAHFDPSLIWRANFYRVEGPAEPRLYTAWQPTRTQEPNFHVPEAFGQLLFLPEK